MDEKMQSAGTMSPLRMLAGFSRGRIVVWIAVAAVAHAVLIGLLSMGYIRDRWIDPEGAATRKATAAAAQEALKKESAAKIARPPVATGTATTAVAKAMVSSTGTTEQILKDRKDAPVVKRITEKAQHGAIPAQPNDLGISIGDTDVH